MNRRGLFRGLFGAAVGVAALPVAKAGEFAQVAAPVPEPEAAKPVSGHGHQVTHTSMITYDDIVRDGLRQMSQRGYGR